MNAPTRPALWRRVVVQATPEQARGRLRDLIEQHDDGDYAGLKQLMGRSAGYLRRYVRQGSPTLLGGHDRRMLASYFRIDERELGGPDPE
ncbi:hypothetical protein [Sphingomonas nostoxanthinifaciens]|uniref:hypothetical protein n=1 Tax=Sphingomonas nostoxanthinifaciens TaxID=2872652 RepID=UPI001CC1CCD2|nr:hypothetical protein [Sphingomonas nostoxanthinifaciens]UAK25888.1 hypothetical protein K8P63_07140 [Sphingomonas nostoxanthinifaciens]